MGVSIDKTITEFVLKELGQRGLDVVAASFDGKSHPRITTGMTGEPQTVIQLAKQHWKRMKDIKTINEFYECIKNQENQGVPRLALLALQKLHTLRYS